MDESDEALCCRVATGDETAFEVLIERYRGRAYRWAWAYLRNAEDARDVSQEAFVRLYERAKGFDGRGRFATWFYRILVNLSLDRRRRDRWWRRVFTAARGENGLDASRLAEMPAATDDALEALSRMERVERLWSAVDRLPAQQRLVVLLQAQEDLSTAEIATVLECAEVTVRVHLHRALTTLRRTVGGR